MTDSAASFAVAGGELWYRLVNPEAPGVPLVLIHGGPGIPSYYLEPLLTLADERPVLIYDQLGCGRSSHDVNEQYLTLDSFAADLNQLLSGLGLDRVVLWGHSFGGLLALAHQRRYPDAAAGLILASPLITTKAWLADAEILIAELPEPYRTDIRRDPADERYQLAEDEFYARHLCALDPWPELLQRSMSQLATEVYHTMWGPNEFTQSGNLAGADEARTLAETQVPVLITTGSADEARPATLQRFAATAPDARLVVLEPGTHSVHLEQPAEYLAVVREFVKQFS